MNDSITQWLPIVLSSITAVAALAAPIINSVIQQNGNIKIKKMETIYQNKFTVYKNFSDAYGFLLGSGCLDYYRKLHCAAYDVMLICDEESRKQVAFFLNYIEKIGYHMDTKSNQDFEACMVMLNKDLNS